MSEPAAARRRGGMMDYQSALVAVCNAARAVRQSGMRDVRLDQLYGALDAFEAVGAGSMWDHVAETTSGVVTVRPGLCQADPDCWRTADVGLTCYHHSPQAHAPQVRRREVVFESGESDG